MLAHECGHIACRHSLYRTMGRIILDEAIKFIQIDFVNLAIFPVQVAFAYWMRCGELSADRAAALCDGTSEKVMEMCLRFAGYDKDINAEANIDEFMSQALEYKEMVDDSKWDKTLEFLFLKDQSHPMNAVRAYECSEWSKNERFDKMVTYISTVSVRESTNIGFYLKEAPMPEASKNYIGNNITDVQTTLKDLGFTNVRAVKITQKGLMVKDGQVLNIRINEKDGFGMSEWYPIDSDIAIEFYEPETEEEVLAAHPGQLRVPDASKRYIGRLYEDVVNELQNAGFTEIVTVEQKKEKKGLLSTLSKNGGVSIISINGQTQFDKGEWFAEKATIKITYQTFSDKNEV